MWPSESGAAEKRDELASPTGEYADVEAEEDPPRVFPFALDAFQRRAMACVRRGESVLVAAHTSAGKTAVAEYAVAHAMRGGARVIYTSPVKALSNQTFRGLRTAFGDDRVGLMTGDVSLRPSAPCLVMTTEVLRSMLYRGSEAVREVAILVFDEVHYLRDAERGVVWEEAIIMAPPNVALVFLSATLSNAAEFAAWVCGLKRRVCHVVSTARRPTPLRHYLAPPAGRSLYLALGEAGGAARDDCLEAALAAASLEAAGQSAASSAASARAGVVRVLRACRSADWLPAIVFSFSRRQCEAHATRAVAELDLCSEAERAAVREVHDNALASLAEEDRVLPQVSGLLPLLLRGVALHHSGLVPVLRELVELLFQEGLVKVLFATETFALGVNMPARTVVFTSMRKFDGRSFRWVSPGEYTQLSGRAGRRGCDRNGVCVLLADPRLEAAHCRVMLGGRADPLRSQFRLTYSGILNQTRAESAVSPRGMVERSFFRFQAASAALPAAARAAAAAAEARDAAVAALPPPRASVAELARAAEAERVRDRLRREVAAAAAADAPAHLLPFLQPGRAVLARGLGWGVALGWRLRHAPASYEVDVAVLLASGEGAVRAVPAAELDAVSSVRLYVPPDVRGAAAAAALVRSLPPAARFPGGELPALDAVRDLGLGANEGAARAAGRLAAMGRGALALLGASPAHRRAAALCREADEARAAHREAAREAGLVRFEEELERRTRVLRRLGHLDEGGGVLLPKGRVACEIDCADELLLAEVVFSGLLGAPLSAGAAVALLVCLLPADRGQDRAAAGAHPVPPELAAAVERLGGLAREVARVSGECGVPYDPEQFRPTLVRVVHAWCAGASFADVCGMTTLFEGSVIRVLRRLRDLVLQLTAAVRDIGDAGLADKLDEGARLLTRGIIFAASLYTV